MPAYYTATAFDNDKNKYLFYVFDKSARKKFPEKFSAVYMFVRELKCRYGVCYLPLYVGETEELGIRFSNHHKEEKCTEYGFTHIFVSPTKKEDFTRYETALFHHYVPICNDQPLPEALNNDSYIENARRHYIGRSERLQEPWSFQSLD